MNKSSSMVSKNEILQKLQVNNKEVSENGETKTNEMTVS